jgi:hypothetical protein
MPRPYRLNRPALWTTGPRWPPRARCRELRKAIKLVNRTLAERKVEKHPDKTTIGRTQRDLTFSGYHLPPQGLSLASKPFTRASVKRGRPVLCEQGTDEPRLGQYTHLRRYCARAAGGAGPTPAWLWRPDGPAAGP